VAKSKNSKNSETPPVDSDVGFLEPEEYHKAVATQIWSYDDTGHDLTVEEQLFCRSYIVDRNPVAALRRLNYAGTVPELKRIADRHLRNPEVQGCIEVLAKRIMDNLDITADRVNRRLAAIAFADRRRIMEFDHSGVRLIHSKYWTEEDAAALAGVEMGQNGIKVKFHDTMRALEILGKQVGIVDSEAEMARQAAEAGAAAALAKVFQTVERIRGDGVNSDPPIEAVPVQREERDPTKLN